MNALSHLSRAILLFGCCVLITSPIRAEQMDLLEMAEAIQEGNIDVGKQYGMHKKRGRYHRIHSEVLGMECESCHVGKKYAPDYLLLTKEEEERRAAGQGKRPKSDVVDRSVCLGCHKTNGIATPWYRTADQ